MPERYLGRLKPEMNVCDVAGRKVGTIAHIYSATDAALAASGATSPATLVGESPHHALMEVKTGFLGLGARLYIPLGAIQETLNECVFLAKPREAFERLGWHDKPSYVDRLR